MKIEEINHQRILYSCNDWGLGHVSRSVGIIRQLLKQKNTLYFAGTSLQQEIICSYFPLVNRINMSGYDFQFKGSNNWNREIIRNAFKLFFSIKKENKTLHKLCKTLQIQCIISDHRYGFFHTKIPSFFVTHQVNLPLKGVQKLVQRWHLKQLKKFTAIWVVDDSTSSYAGKLSDSKNLSLNIFPIGIQSRFISKNTSNQIEPYILAVISGPFPYSLKLFEEILEYAKTTKTLVKCIVPTHLNLPKIPSKNILFYSTNNWKEIDELYHDCIGVISRSGYSTLMDVETLQKKACLIPTPGQPEQLYLSKLHEYKYTSKLSNLAPDYFNTIKPL